MKKPQPQDLNRMMDLWAPKYTTKVGAPWKQGVPWGASENEDEDQDVMEEYLKRTFPKPKEWLFSRWHVAQYFKANPHLFVEFLYGPAVMYKLEILPEHRKMFNAAFTLAACGYTAEDIPMAHEIIELLGTEYLSQFGEALGWGDRAGIEEDEAHAEFELEKYLLEEYLLEKKKKLEEKKKMSQN